MLRRNGEVRGLFELFSDHPYAFEERDLIALERMAELTLTALDLAEQRQSSGPAPRLEPGKPVESPIASSAQPASAISPHTEAAKAAVISVAPPAVLPEALPVVLPDEPPEISPATPAPLPEAMLRVQKCASCGFPVSEGRTLCLDCEKKDSEKKDTEKKQREKEQAESKQGEPEQDTPSSSAASMPEDFVPDFLANSAPAQRSWWANPVNLVAIVVLILGILVAIVVFR